MKIINMILISGHSIFEVASGVALLLLPTICLPLPALDLGHVLLANLMKLDHTDSEIGLLLLNNAHVCSECGCFGAQNTPTS